AIATRDGATAKRLASRRHSARFARPSCAGAATRTSSTPFRTPTTSSRWEPARTRTEIVDLSEIHGEESVRSIEPFQLHVSALEEVDAGIGYELAHDARYEDLSTQGLAGDARRIVDGRAEEPVGLVERVAGVDTDPDADRRRGIRK